MRLVYCALEHDYGDPSRGPSFEHMNFFDTLTHMPLEVVHFAIDTEILAHGYVEANRRLKALVDVWRPHALFSVMFEEQLDFDVVRQITYTTETATIGWFCDDHWRFGSYSKYWAHALGWAVTTDAAVVPLYRAIGAAKPISSQWACNHFAYHRVETPADIDVSFVGQPHGGRRKSIDRLRSRGVTVLTRGQGWPEGAVPQEEMIRIFSCSRVNLNFSASSARGWLFRRKSMPQIKGRVFEVPGCGGLLLTDWAPALEKYYVPGTEIVVARNDEEMARHISELLSDEDRRAAIALAGYKRTMADHTYEKRLVDIFSCVGLTSEYRSRASGRVLDIEEIL